MRQQFPDNLRKRGLVLLLLTAIVLVGASFRFMSLNWDDFASLHPDERFLTRNLLPLLGGRPEFTNDPAHYPPHVLIVPTAETALQNSFDVHSDQALRVGAVGGTQAADLTGWWVGEPRAERYDSLEEALAAMRSGAVAALLVEQATWETSPYSDGRILDTLDSPTVQRIRCTGLFPETGGAGGYFNTDCSPYNPHNANAGMYAYGTLPLFLARFSSDFLQQVQIPASDFEGSSGLLATLGDFFSGIDYQGDTLVWRFWSAFFDVGTIIVVFFIGRRLHNGWVGLLAAALYAFAPLAIQKAHFGTVNAITGFFVALALWAAVAVQDKGRYFHFALFGAALGAALGGRINVIPLAGVVVLAAMVNAAPVLDRRIPWEERERLLWRNVFGVFLAGFATVLTFRLVNPYAFEGPTFFHIIPNPRWLADASNSSFAVSGASDIPPNWQWLGRASYLYPLKDMLLWGMGLAMGVMAWVGWAWSGYRIVRGRDFALRNLLPFVWVLVYFAWIGGLWVMTMRYFLPLYSSLAVLAAWALYELVRQARKRQRDVPLTHMLLTGFGLVLLGIPAYALHMGGTLNATLLAAAGMGAALLMVAVIPRIPRRAYVLGGFVLAFSLLWALMFTNIYHHQVTRVQASRWVWENVPGDFAMQIDGAPEGTPLINIAVGNALGNSANNPEEMPALVTRYEPNVPRFVPFTPAASGTIHVIHAPHLVDPLGATSEKTLYISISQTVNGDTVLLSEVTLTEQFSAENHILGDAYDIVLPEPLEVEAGVEYSFKVEALDGPLLSSGAVMLTEGTWDDRITTTMVCHLPGGLTYADDPPPGLASYESCNGLLSNQGLLQSYDLAMSYPVDEEVKLESIVDGLGVGDYLAITSNRFYDTLTRNPSRWPLSTAYYEALFDGELGYELVQVFQEGYEFGPFSVDDQHLPIYESPAWLNELEADEAFHVYDHPVVYIFRKSDDYDHAAVRARLETIPLQQVHQVEGNGDVIGVVYWSSLEADAAPTALMMPTDIEEANTEGGTWSKRFDSDSLLNTNQPLGVVVWWLLIIALGIITWPVLFTAFPRLADKGYGFTKAIALLLTGWIAWVGSSLKVPLWSQSGLLLVVLSLAALSAYLAYRRREDLREYLQDHWKRLLAIEVITLLLFGMFIFVRLTNPDLWHHPMGGEKPMDFAYFNAVLRSTVFPAYDPWFAGGYINYYYVGYVLVGVPVLLLKIVPAFAYNLIVPTLFAVTGIGAFSVAFNITANWQTRRTQRTNGEKKRELRRMGNPWIAGVAALMLTVVLGNLDTPRVFINEGVARLGGYSRPEGLEQFLMAEYADEHGEPPVGQAALDISQRAARGYLWDEIRYEVTNVVELVSSTWDGLKQMADGAPLPIGSNRWYWGPTRVLAETPSVGGGAITEMPFFTFVYGDLHAHMINLPYLLFALLFVYYEVAHARRDNRGAASIALALFLGALTVGMMRAVNTWDWPSFMLLALVGLAYAWWRRWGTLHRLAVAHFLLFVGGFGVLAMAVVAPYTSWYASIYNSVAPWEGGRTPLWAYLDIHGLFLFLLVSLLIWETARSLRQVRVAALRGRGLLLVSAAALGGLLLVSAVGATLAGYQVALIAVPLIVWIAMLFFRPGQSPEMQTVLVFMGFALALTLGVEVIVISGDINRQNTVFKFYMQAWVLFSVGGGVAFAWLFQHLDYWHGALRWLWFAPLTVLLVVASLFPMMATRARMVDRMAPDTPPTLNGLDYMQYAEHFLIDYAVPIDLTNDHAIIRWLQENVSGTPVIMEGRSAASEYRYNSRISINTGLPSVLGWNWHQRQQRTLEPLSRIVFQREANVQFFYNTTDIASAVGLLRIYEVRYIIVSDMERVIYPAEGLAKFERMQEMGLLDVAFEQDGARVYGVNPGALDRFVLEHIEVYEALGLDTSVLPGYGSYITLNPDYVPDGGANVDAVVEVLGERDVNHVFVADLPAVQQYLPAVYDRLLRLEEEGILESTAEYRTWRVYQVDHEALRDFRDED